MNVVLDAHPTQRRSPYNTGEWRWPDSPTQGRAIRRLISRLGLCLFGELRWERCVSWVGGTSATSGAPSSGSARTWMSGVSMGRPWLAKTTDGGTTWTSVYLIPPKELGHGLMETGPVTMGDRGAGVVPVTFGVAHQAFAFSPGAYKPSGEYAPPGCPCEALYVTGNAGRTWAPTSVVTVHPATGSNPYGVLAEVLGGGVAWMFDGIHLWATDNYGTTWTLLSGQR